MKFPKMFGGGEKPASRKPHELYREASSSERTEKKALVPDFSVQPELESLVLKLRDAGVRVSATVRDGNDEEHNAAVEHERSLVEEHRAVLEPYLAPYRAFTGNAMKSSQEQVAEMNKRFTVSQEELPRYLVARALWSSAE